MLEHTKLRYFWAQIVSWAPIHARDFFMVLAPDHSETNSTSLGRIQPSCNYCVKTTHSYFHHCLLPGINTAERTKAPWRQRKCPCFQTSAKGILSWTALIKNRHFPGEQVVCCLHIAACILIHLWGMHEPKRAIFYNTVEPLLYDHRQNHIDVVV